MEYLGNTSYTITEIAQRVGFMIPIILLRCFLGSKRDVPRRNFGRICRTSEYHTQKGRNCKYSNALQSCPFLSFHFFLIRTVPSVFSTSSMDFSTSADFFRFCGSHKPTGKAHPACRCLFSLPYAPAQSFFSISYVLHIPWCRFYLAAISL